MQKRKLLDINLRLFDGTAGAGAGGDAGGGASQGMEGALSKADNPGSSRRNKAGAYDNVVFGKQETATPAPETGVDPVAGGNGEDSTKKTPEDRQKEFEALINGEFKEEFTKKFQDTFNRRFKDSKVAEESLAAQKPIIDMLMKKHGIEDGDIGKLKKIIEDEFIEEEAEERGMTNEQTRNQLKLEKDSEELAAIREQMALNEKRRQADQAAREKIAQWRAEAAEVQKVYPSFDLDAESANMDFRKMLQLGVPMQKVYEVIHMDEIKKNSAQAAGMQLVQKIKSKAARPSENGTSSQSAAVIKSDVHSLTKADRAAAVKQAERGKRIVW